MKEIRRGSRRRGQRCSLDEINTVYNISEIFYSLQGEGMHQGLPMVFIRLSGCNLRCKFCDTKYALKPGRKREIDEILKEIKKYPCRRVCITGGEPFIQPLLSLVTALHKKNYWVAAETNGTVWQRLPMDWLTVSPKTGGKKFHPDGYDKRFLKNASEFKYVITDKRSLDFVDRKIKTLLIMQPADNNLKAAKEITEFLKKNPGDNRYLRMQLHKITGMK